MSVAVDLQGAEVVKPYAKDTTFPTVVDSENKLAGLLGLKIVPNGIFLDEEGTIRMIKQGFSVANQEHVQAIEKLLRAEVETVAFDSNSDITNVNEDLQIQLAQTKFKLAMEYTKQGKKKEALKELDEALLLDTDNFLIRKQRWYLRFPDKFTPDIDIKWQQQQLKSEKSAEAAMNKGEDCGPEGCIIPKSKPK